MKADACHSYESTFDSYCSGVCDNIDRFRAAGAVMLFFGLISIIFMLTSIFFHLNKLRKPWFRMSYTWLLIILPTVSYVIGLLTYLSIVNPNGIDSTSNDH